MAKAQQSTQALGDRVKGASDTVGGAATAVSGLSSALGGLGGKANEITGALANLGTAMVASGPLGIGIAAAVTAVGLLAKTWNDSKEAARLAAESWDKHFREITKGALEDVRALRDELLLLQTGSPQAAALANINAELATARRGKRAAERRGAVEAVGRDARADAAADVLRIEANIFALEQKQKEAEEALREADKLRAQIEAIRKSRQKAEDSKKGFRGRVKKADAESDFTEFGFAAGGTLDVLKDLETRRMAEEAEKTEKALIGAVVAAGWLVRDMGRVADKMSDVQVAVVAVGEEMSAGAFAVGQQFVIDSINGLLAAEENAIEKALAAAMSSLGNQLIGIGVKGVFEGTISGLGGNPAGWAQAGVGAAAISAGIGLAAGGGALAGVLPGAPSAGSGAAPTGAVRSSRNGGNGGGPVNVTIQYGTFSPRPEDTAKEVAQAIEHARSRGFL